MPNFFIFYVCIFRRMRIASSLEINLNKINKIKGNKFKCSQIIIEIIVFQNIKKIVNNFINVDFKFI